MMLGGILMRDKHPFGTTALPCVRVREAILGYRRHARARKQVVAVNKYTQARPTRTYRRRYRETSSRTLTHVSIVAASVTTIARAPPNSRSDPPDEIPHRQKRMAAAFLAVPRRHP